MDKRIIISDLDGTLSNYEKRKHFYNSKNYFEFNKAGIEDTPIENVCNILRNLKDDDTDIVIMTARDEYHRSATLEWLKIYDIPCDKLLMRKSDDSRWDDKVKEHLFLEHYKPKDIWFVLEDRQICVDMWRKLGLTCLQPRDGDF